jgi:uncharacterized protein (UPF0276 family)
MAIGIGWVLQPDDAHLALTAPLLAHVDFLELAPETCWRVDRRGALAPNGFAERFAAERARGLPFVAHGVGLSMAGDPARDAARRAAWLERVRADHDVFRFAWWTDHFGATTLAGEEVALPVPVPHDEETLARLEATLDAMQAVVPDVGFENTAFHFAFSAPEAEPWLFRRALRREGRWLLLDLHNLVLDAESLGFDPRRWLATVDLSRVIEIHVAGGAESDPRWLPSGRVFRLDGHDHDVPEEVWTLLSEVLPRCTRLRCVTLERMEGTVESAHDVATLRDELARLRGILDAPVAALEAWPAPFDEPVLSSVRAADLEARYAASLRAETSSAPHAAPTVESAHEDGLRMTALLVAKLRFERTQRGSALASAWFDRDPSGFARAFRAYHASVPARSLFPAPEADEFLRFCVARGFAPPGPGP